MIREAREGSRKRTWTFLWNAICNHLDFVHEDANYATLAAGLNGRSVAGAAAWATEGVTNESYETYGAAAADQKGKGKG